MSRIEWAGGWAELDPNLTHGRRMRIVRVLPDRPSGRGAATPEMTTAEFLGIAPTIAAAHISAWSGPSFDPVYGPPAEALDALPPDAVDSLVNAAVTLWSGAPDPNVTTPTSAPGRTESA